MARIIDFVFYFFVVVLAFAVIMTFFSVSKTTGYATSSTTSSNVTISTYFAITLSANLSSGIRFGTVSVVPSTLINATSNYDLNATTPAGTTYWANVSTDSNTGVDFCLSSNRFNTAGGDFLGIGNQSYSNSTVSINITNPIVSGGYITNFTSSATKASGVTAVGGTTYYRFWLAIPPAQPAGTYNNTVTVAGVATGGSC